MSHGSSDKCEPNFTPLLDLVLQLVMFFMLCANFVMDQTNVDIKLPLATTARAIEATEPYVLYLNVNEKGQVIYPPGALGKDGESSDNPVQLAIYLKRRADEDRLIAGPGNEDKALRTLIVLRVHKACPFEKTYPVMKACRSAGYQRVQLRAILAGSGPG